MNYIDINCDVGEGVGNEKDLLPLISSCNIACGGHAGDKDTMANTIRLAKKNRVRIGAHPGYPDKINFGRKKMEMAPEDLISSIQEQLSQFLGILKTEGGELHHIKPHGALYNGVAKDENLANIFLDAMDDFKEVPLYVPYFSKIQKVASKRGFRFFLEAFADRNYQADLKLVSRTRKDAVITKSHQVLEHLLNMAKHGQVKSLDGELMEIKAHTYCIHGDTPSALEILMYLHQELPNYNIQIKR